MEEIKAKTGAGFASREQMDGLCGVASAAYVCTQKQ